MESIGTDKQVARCAGCAATDRPLHAAPDGQWLCTPCRGPDPTYGRIDRDIQRMVDEWGPASLGQRVAVENTIQARRDRGERLGAPD